MAKKKYYAVRKGRKTGVYTQWFGPEGAHVQVVGYPGAEFKGFPTRTEAEKFLKPQSVDQPMTIESDDHRIQVFTDGGAVGNPGPGGFGAVIIQPDGQPQELCGAFQWTTNNRMELMGCIRALEALDPSLAVALHSDSRYLVDAVTKGWARSWRRRGWKKANGAPALNTDLWGRLLVLLEGRDVLLKWVKGHAGNIGNERCDQLVHEAIAKGDFEIDEGYEA